jgi:hypothetical protein
MRRFPSREASFMKRSRPDYVTKVFPLGGGPMVG